MEKDLGQLTFRDLDGNIVVPEPTWPLEKWYADIRDTRIANLSVADLARSCRQEINLEAIVPFCLLKLEEDPLAGELYDGELARTLWRLPDAYWRLHPQEEARFLEVVADL